MQDHGPLAHQADGRMGASEERPAELLQEPGRRQDDHVPPHLVYIARDRRLYGALLHFATRILPGRRHLHLEKSCQIPFGLETCYTYFLGVLQNWISCVLSNSEGSYQVGQLCHCCPSVFGIVCFLDRSRLQV